MSDERKQKVAKMMEDLKDQKCAWPGCDKNKFISMSLQVVKQGEKGLEPIPGVGVPVNFCQHHFFIAQSGLCLGLQSDQGIQMLAPTDMVNVAEAVIRGFVFSGQLDELMTAKKGVDEKKRKYEDELNDELKQKKDAEHKGN